MPTTISITPPRDYLLHRDVCSYGYFLLAPNRWTPATRTFTRILLLPTGPATIHITQANTHRPKPGGNLTIHASRTINKPELTDLHDSLTRMLRLDENHTHTRAFHKLDPRFKHVGYARLFRSPTMFEDVIKTVTSCNVTWPNTINMNTLLCHHYGPGGSFPTPAIIARLRPANLRGRCRVGYRDARIVHLAKMFNTGQINPTWFQDPANPDDAVRQALLDLPGIGPYAASNIMQLLGRYAYLPLDSESVRHGRTVLGFKGHPAAIIKRIQRHYEPMGNQQFRSYWFEIWNHYESKRGPAWTWDRETTGKTFTAAQLK